MSIRRAVVFPGQGTRGGRASGEIGEIVERQTGGGETPYQLSVFARSMDLLLALEAREIRPDVVAGHSLGEYAAACAAGSMALKDGVRLVAARDRLMNEAAVKNPGGMLAVIGAEAREVAEAAESHEGVAVAANFNTPRQTVLSGERAALEAAAGRLEGRKISLDVAGAFHSPLMHDAAVAMEVLLGEVALRDPQIPMVAATDGAVLATADDVRLALRNQMLSPVRWVAVVERLVGLGVEEMIEAGDDGTLVRMLRDFDQQQIRGRKAAQVLA